MLKVGRLTALAFFVLAVVASIPGTSSGAVVTKTFSSGNLNRGLASDGFVHERFRVPARGKLKDVDLKMRMYDPDLSDLLSVELGNPYTHNIDRTLELVSGGGFTGADLGQGPGKCASQLTVFDDEALTPVSAGTGPYVGSFAPDQLLSASFDGERMTGKWLLDIQNGHEASYAALYCWKLRLTYRPAS